MKAITHTLVGLGLALFGLMAGAQEAPSKQITLDIKPQPMVDALNGWAQQTGFQIIAPDADAVNKLDAPRVRGRLTAQAALSKLLAGTPLTYEFVNERTVAIHEQFPVSVPAASTPVAGKQVNKGFLRVAVAQVEEAAGRSSDGGAAESESRAIAAADAREGENNKRRRGVLEEVIVTAQKREERLQNVPISIAVVGGDNLDRSSFTAVTEILNNVPGVATIVDPGGSTQVAVRGVTAASANFSGSSPIAYYVDSVPFGLVRTAIAPDLAPYDLDRIEVLRGPQGTLYGASALNGVVRVLTKDAELDELSFKARALVSTTEEGGGNYGGDAAINVPLIDGRLAARAVLGYQDQSGWIESPVRHNVNGADLRNYRLKINGSLTERLSMRLSAWQQRDDYGGISASEDDFMRPQSKPESISKDLDSYGLTIGYESSLFSVTSMTSFLDYKSVLFLDLNFQDLVVMTDLRSRVFSQELILNSRDDANWRWTVGAFYRDGEDRTQQGFFLHQGSLLVDSYVPLDQFDDKSQSLAFFGEIGRRFANDRWGLTVGLRRFYDDVSTQMITPPVLPNVPFEPIENSFDATTPRVVLTWFPSRDLTLYASYSEGFRSGFPQDELVTTLVPDFPPLEPDDLRNYEIGAKGSLGERVSFDAAVFYIDWDSLQQVVGIPLSDPSLGFAFASVNGESASGMGFDLALAAKPVDALDVRLSVGWNDITMDQPVFSAGTLLFNEGDRLTQSPEYTVGASAEYSFTLGASGYQARLLASATYTSEQKNSTIIGGPGTVAEGDPMLISRLRFAIEAPDRWSAALFVDNLNDERGSPLSWIPVLPEYDVRVRPRTVGVQLEYRF